jgi:VWFA-related protein
MRISRRLLLGQLLTGSGFGICRARAQDPVFSADSRAVTLMATVHNSAGRLVPDLNKEDFILTEDGRTVEIRYFSREADLPLTIGLMIDTSASQFWVLERERRGAYAFLDRVLRPDRDRAFVTKFDVKVIDLCSPTANLAALQHGLSQADLPLKKGAARDPKKEPNRIDILIGTKLRDAVKAASEGYMRKATGRKALLLLTDGNDFGSKTTLDQAIEHAQRSDTMVYSIFYPDPKGYPNRRTDPASGLKLPVVKGTRVLRRLASQTGGGFFAVTAEQPLEEVLDRIQAELRTQYSIGFIPDANGPNEYRRLSLRAKGDGLVVRSREGYYAR